MLTELLHHDTAYPDGSREDGTKVLRRAAERDGVFCHTFFKAVVRKPATGII